MAYEPDIYLKMLSVEEATSKYDKALQGMILPRSEVIPVSEALDRVTLTPVFAACSSPLFNCSAMDGITVTAARTSTASQVAPLALRKGVDFEVVDTGDPIHPPFNSVIMSEDLIRTDEPDVVKITASAAPWQHVRPIGEDIATGEMLMCSRHTIRPIDIGVLLSGGITQIEVSKRPLVAVIPTGTEIIEPGDTPREGSIIESNSRMFAAMISKCGAAAHRFDTVPDDRKLLREALEKALAESDAVIINAGSSAGTEDYTAHILSEMGQVIVHGVAIKPGKPVILAIVDGKPVIGLPGYPVSAYIAFELFVTPLLAHFTGSAVPRRDEVEAVISRRVVSSLRYREYVRVKAGMVDGRMVAAPLARGAGAAMSLVRADGFCIIEQDHEGVEAGDKVKLVLTRPKSEIEHTIVSVGSHDIILDVIADILPNRFPGVNISSTHVGSTGGLMALKRGETVLAPTHLLDERTGEYNIPYMREIFGLEPMALIKGVGRIQGIIVANGNPLGIRDVKDLTKARYINRQRGAGTRLLFDYLLKKAGLTFKDIDGYELEVSTHMAVAAAIKGGSADAGMGVFSAAKAMGLDFIPLGDEEYDFALKQSSLELYEVKAFIELLKSRELHQRIEELGGYSTRCCGEVILIAP